MAPKKPVSQSDTMWVKKGTYVNGAPVQKGYLAQYGKPEKRVTNAVKLVTTQGSTGNVINNRGGVANYSKGRNVTGKPAPRRAITGAGTGTGSGKGGGSTSNGKTPTRNEQNPKNVPIPDKSKIGLTAAEKKAMDDRFKKAAENASNTDKNTANNNRPTASSFKPREGQRAIRIVNGKKVNMVYRKGKWVEQGGY